MSEALEIIDEEQQLEHLPERPNLVVLTRKKSFLHTGKIVGKDKRLCRLICLELLLGQHSITQLAKLHRVSQNTIRSIRQIMHDRGELDVIAKTVKGQLDRAVLLGLWRWNEGLLDGSVHPGQVPIPTCAMIDKRAQLDAGMIPGTGITESEAKLSSLQASAQALGLLKSVVVDCPPASIEHKTSCAQESKPESGQG